MKALVPNRTFGGSLFCCTLTSLGGEDFFTRSPSRRSLTVMFGLLVTTEVRGFRYNVFFGFLAIPFVDIACLLTFGKGVFKHISMMG